MARIPYRDPNSYSEDDAKLMGKAPAMNIFRMLTHADSAARQYMRLGNALLTRGELDPVLRELAILRVGHLSHAEEFDAQLALVQRASRGVAGAVEFLLELIPHAHDASWRLRALRRIDALVSTGGGPSIE